MVIPPIDAVGVPPMASIEISDGVTCRQIRVPSLSDSIRIELHSADGPRLIVPENVAVEQPAP